MFKKIALLVITFFLSASAAFASIGVGISNGKIIIDEKLKPGAVYNLPDFIVFNTGTQATDYEITIEHNRLQTQSWPDQSWFQFSPQKFNLYPKASQNVKVSLYVPIKAKPGDYFAYINAHPIVSIKEGSTSIGVAAASKLYFTVVPSNVFMAIYFRIASLLMQLSPWSYIAIFLLLLVLFGFIFIKKFKIQFNIKRKQDVSN